jgi:hypothetical protein
MIDRQVVMWLLAKLHHLLQLLAVVAQEPGVIAMIPIFIVVLVVNLHHIHQRGILTVVVSLLLLRILNSHHQ